MEEWGQAQALAGGAAGVGRREGAASTQTKPAVAADVTALLLSLRAAAGTPGHSLLCIHVESCSASHPGLLGALSAKPSASVGRRAGWAERGGIFGCWEQGLRGHQAAPPGLTPATPVQPAFALCLWWCQTSREQCPARGQTRHLKVGLRALFHPGPSSPASESNHSQEGKKLKQIEDSEVNMPCVQSCVIMCFRKSTTHFSLNLHLNTSPVSPLAMWLAL